MWRTVSRVVSTMWSALSSLAAPWWWLRLQMGRYVNDMIIVTGADARIIDVNDRAVAVLGYTRRELLSMTVPQIRDPATIGDFAAERRRQQLQGQSVFETRHRRKDGTIFPVEVSVRAFKVRGRTYHQGTVRDISERRRADEERSFRLMLLETMHEAVVGLDPGRRVRSWNSAAERMYGYSKEEAIGRYVADISGTVYPDGEADRVRIFQQIAREGHLSSRLHQRRRDGTPIEVEAEAVAIRSGADGPLEGFLLVNRDITARNRAEDALRESEAKFRAAFDGAGLSMALVDESGRVLEYNRAFREMLGYEGDELRGRDLASLMHPDDRCGAHLDFRERPGGAAEIVIGERRYRRMNGSYVHGLLRSSVVRDVAGKFLYSIALIEDLTKKKAIEAQLLLADRMSSMGRLAAGVAHEINNPLAFVDANVVFALAELRRTGAASAAVIEALEESRHGTLRVRDIVRDLKTFSRADGADDAGQACVDVREVLQSAINLAHNELKHRARVAVTLAPVPCVLGNARRLGQVFLNLLLNAAQSIDPGHADRNEIRISCSTDGAGHIAVDVEDTGCGIDPEILPRIFEPFFTTKPVGVGTGLGLSICHGIVKDLGGDITVESRPGNGSRFRVVLRAGPGVAPTSVTGRAAPPGDGPRGRILVVDDEPMVGRAVARILRDEHEVEVVSNAREALARMHDAPDYDVILCDVMMPEMTGIEMYHRLAAIEPSAKERVVFLTGGAFTPNAQAFLGGIRNERIDKPFEAMALRATINDLVSRRRAEARDR